MFRRLLFKNFRFVYRLSQWSKYRLTPAGLLIAGSMLSAGIFGVDIRQSMAFQVFTITFSLLALSLLASLSFRGRFSIRRKLPRFGSVNQAIKYQLQIQNDTAFTQTDLLAIDDLEASLPDYRAFINSSDPQDKNRNWFDRFIGYPRLLGLIRKRRGGSVQPQPLAGIAAGEMTELNLELLPSRRGYVRFSSVRISRPGPLGLVRGIKKYGLKNELLILPKTYRAPKIELRGVRKYQQGGMNQASAVGDSQEFMSLREYRPGDPLRAIHWRSYARVGSPVVKEFHDEFFVRQGLLLDTFQEDKSSEIFEEAVSVAASFCLTLPTQDALLDLMFVGNRAYRFTSGRGLGQTENMLEVLACTHAVSDDSFTRLHDMIPAYSSETSGMICILLDWDAKRQHLIEAIMLAGIPVVVYIVVNRNDNLDLDLGPLKHHPERLLTLPCGDIQTALDRTVKSSSPLK